MKMTKSTLELLFQTETGQKVRIQIPNPKEPVDAAAVNALMDQIVQKNIFFFKSGDIVRKVGAQVNSTTQSPIALG
jgi:hypothetical protein